MSTNPIVLPEIRVAPLPLYNPWRERIEEARRRRKTWWGKRGRFLAADKMLAECWECCATSYYGFGRGNDAEEPMMPNNELVQDLGFEFYDAVQEDRVDDAARILEEIERHGALIQDRA